MDCWRNAMSFLSFELFKAPAQTHLVKRSFAPPWAKNRAAALGKKGTTG
jgi:hypothetical protein